ncbi:SH3 domain-containing protein [Rhizobium sp. BG4]|uniref:SH3 domain-containing protein n=1 Tax=Rhizobium sp. BG4 TaxID=2613770 RepID=UPI00193D1631|nr:SH3 domain-containing protein [Rhizobium sp. BG4]
MVVFIPCDMRAEEMKLGVVVTQKLNMRAQPNTQGAVVAELPLGMKIAILSGHVGDWREIGAVIDNATKTGWVREKFIAEVSRTPPNSPPEAGPKAPRYTSPFSISNSDLDCKEDYISGGYSSCDYTVTVEYNGDRDVEGTFSVSCDVEARMEHRDDLLPSRRSFQGYSTLYVSSGYGSTTVDVTLRPGFSLEPLLRVKVTDTQCRYDR